MSADARPTVHDERHPPVAADDPRWALTSPRAAADLIAPDRPHPSQSHAGLSAPDLAVTLTDERRALLDLPDAVLRNRDPDLYAEVVRLRDSTAS